jgi:hypothetical protein
MTSALVALDGKEVTQQQLTVVLLFLEGLIKETLSADVLDLASAHAATRAIELGVDMSASVKILLRIREYAEARRKSHPFASLF